MRADGRAKDKLRKLKITKDYIRFAEGSCLFELGNTKVICAASIEKGVPQFLRNKGRGWITAEYSMLPRSCQMRISRESSRGKIGGRTHEIQRLIGRSLRGVVDLARLGERTIWLDADVVQGDGGTRCAAITGCFIALCGALHKLEKKGMFDKLPVNNFVAAVSAGVINGEVLLDLDYEEDSKADVDMNIVMTDSDKFIEIQGAAEGAPFDNKMMNSIIGVARKGIRELLSAQKKVLGKVVDWC